MSYIEKKYNNKIRGIFDNLSTLDKDLLGELSKKSVKNVNDIAILCSQFNKNVNLILKKYYPEIKDMKYKLQIKSILKFYYDLIYILTDLVRNVENYQKIDQEYYNKLIRFINDKVRLISGKYKDICAQELTAFYDQNTRDNLEKILIEKIKSKDRQFFTYGSLEEEIKKIGRLSGANSVIIMVADELSKEEIETAQSLILFNIEELVGFKELDKIGVEIKKFLESKDYICVIKHDTLITDAKLLPD